MKATSQKRTKSDDEALADRDDNIASDDDLAARKSEENLQEFFGQFPELATVTISVLDENTGRWKFLATASHDVVTEEYIQKRFKGGHYRLQLRSPKGLLGTKTQVQIADPIEDARNVAPATTNIGMGGLDAMAILQQQIQRQHETTLALIQRDRPAAAGMGLAEILPLVKLLQGSQSNSLADQLETLKSLKELTGDGGDGDWMKTLREMLMPLLAAKLAGRAAAPRGKQIPAGDEMDAEMEAVILDAIAKLKPMAEAGADPVVMARVAFNYAQRDPAGLEFLSDLAEQRFPVALAMLGQFDADLTREPLAGWLEIFHGALKDELHGVADTERNRGNQGNAPRHGEPGAPGTARTDHQGDGDGSALKTG